MEAIYPLRDHGYERLTELTLDGLLTPITASTWARRGTVLSAEDRARALADEVGEHLVLSHSSAWWVHTGITRVTYPIHLTTHPRRRCEGGPGQVVHERTIPDADVTEIADLRLTTIERTLYDIMLTEVRDPDADTDEVLADIIDEIGLLRRRRFRDYLEQSPRRPYIARIRDAFERACVEPTMRRPGPGRPPHPGHQPPEMR